MKKMYHYLTNRIFAKCGVYFKKRFIEQAKYEIDIEIRKVVDKEYNKGLENVLADCDN